MGQTWPSTMYTVLHYSIPLIIQVYDGHTYKDLTQKKY